MSPAVVGISRHVTGSVWSAFPPGDGMPMPQIPMRCVDDAWLQRLVIC